MEQEALTEKSSDAHTGFITQFAETKVEVERKVRDLKTLDQQD